MSQGNSSVVIHERARAKVNLTLHVLGRRLDGYHELRSLIAFADIADELTFDPAGPAGLILEGPFAEAIDGENLILKAKRTVAGWLGRELDGAFRLQKRIPVAAGLGGGSSDAAAAIRVLFRAYGSDRSVENFVTKSAIIGADVPVCLYNKAALVAGLGERISPAPYLGTLPAVLVNPGIKVPTAEVFGRLNAPPYSGDWEGEANATDDSFASPEDVALALEDGRNDLQPAAIALKPAIAEVLDALRNRRGCVLARLSGSGPTCFGLFPSPEIASAAADEIKTLRPNWWVAATTLS
ncbi:MAG: 4-(cytidine 5'-diphospho)-2-C-methyl-D-erythritol kinase [Rhodomicrobium sp.]